MTWLVIIALIIFAVLLYFYSWYKSSGIQKKISAAPILMMHSVKDKMEAGISSIPSKKFTAFIDKVKYENFDIAPLGEHLRKLKGNVNGGAAICLSFDDGYADFYQLFREYLEPNSIPATVFVTAGFIGEKASWDYKPAPASHLSIEQLKDLSHSELITIGSHSLSHPDLTRVENDRIETEVMESKKILEDIIGREVQYFSYPFGRFSQSIIDEVKNAGYKAAFCGVPHRFNGSDNLFMIPRIPLNLLDNLFTFTQKIRPGPFSWMEFSRARVIEQFSCLTYRVRGYNG
ncbi:MAG: polysaccharide deacetylase family protein [candidate division Zixibacteria bacterium]|nr:polysaccharide deacetylase family protein [candidate division Zixibacteria bacterium]NIR63729.1 polysaccharide deacetylase family protein [candidate division Zixibacteria bacterium]NIS14686.1 polysaccharide deacetylase family protein [candidate division Zixibacteria bacterium]NIS45685.1 polysaccharide deacetylase family protein [candidate division Zixibacteria bacterium]NIT51214.1 polysaccharide deacetylase family protein [candidate division Zixibacteria bacterium]